MCPRRRRCRRCRSLAEGGQEHNKKKRENAHDDEYVYEYKAPIHHAIGEKHLPNHTYSVKDERGLNPSVLECNEMEVEQQNERHEEIDEGN